MPCGLRHSELGCVIGALGLVGAFIFVYVAETLWWSERREARVVADQRAIHEALRHHLLREGTLPASLAELDDEPLGPDPRDPWDQPWLYLPRRDARGNVTEYALVSLGSDGGRADLRVDWGSAPVSERLERAPSGVGVAHLLPALLSAGLAGALGLGVWWFGRMPAWRRPGVLEPPVGTPGPPRGPRVAVHRASATIHCAWCRDDENELPLLACRGCGTALHAECWGLAAICPTLGCRRRATMTQVARSEPVDAVGGQL